MATHRLGIVMHGVTGRMGLNQHLVRSIVAIRAEGGVALPNGDRVWRLDIDLEGAFSVNFEFSEFVVPEGGRVYAYTPSGEQLGGFTAASNPGHTELGVGLLLRAVLPSHHDRVRVPGVRRVDGGERGVDQVRSTRRVSTPSSSVQVASPMMA